MGEELSSCPECLGTGCLPCPTCDGEGSVVTKSETEREDND